MIKNVENNMSHQLTKEISNDIILKALLQEDDTIHKKRIKLMNEKKY